MISLTKMVTGKATVSKVLTYHSDEHIPKRLVKLSKGLKPVVVWNLTRACNLRCVHCYAHTESTRKEIKTFEVKSVLDDLSNIGVPVILFSGGEPLLRKDLFEIAEYSKKKGLKFALSTNGTLISDKIAEKLKDVGFSYIGVSLDGLKESHDRFRGVEGAFDKALEGLRNSKGVGLLTGIRFTLTRYNVDQVFDVLDLCESEGVERFCLYHLVPSGRADFEIDVSSSERRKIMDKLFDRAFDFKGEILTVDNPCDGVYFCLKLKEIDEDLAYRSYEFLKYRGGDKSGSQLVNIDMFGDVHPNQFWWDYTIGNVREKKFSEIWFESNGLIEKLRNKVVHLRGRCGSCAYKDVCGGFRLRALRYGDLWGLDPSCYLTDEEIAKNVFE